MDKIPTEAMLRALRRVALGVVVKTYRADGNVFQRSNGASASLLRLAEANGWIEDGPTSGGYFVRATMILTPAGQALLDPSK